MRIGIDISQIVYEGTGVARYVKNLVSSLLEKDEENEYVLFGSSLRKKHVLKEFADTLGKKHRNVRSVIAPFPPTVLDALWNRLHVIPIEWFIGPVDVFWSSDWTQPPLAHAYGITTIHDVSFLKFPESFPASIITVQKRRLQRAVRVCRTFFCDSEATKKDVIHEYGVSPSHMTVIYPGVSV